MTATSQVDHAKLFARIAQELPAELLDHLFVAGSLAAACHFAEELESRPVKTKDADLVIHPAGNVLTARQIAKRLLRKGWRPTDKCHPLPSSTPVDELRAIRLHPPEHDEYFIELLNVAAPDQHAAKTWTAVQLSDGWYGLPSFEFLALTAIDRERSSAGLEYASPCMMALANLLSHPEVGTTRIIDTQVLRSAKDLGRAIALAWLAGPDAVDGWAKRWQFALMECFPDRWRQLAQRVGDGLRELLEDRGAMREAWITCDDGLLNGKGVTVEQLRLTAERLTVDVIDPLAELARVAD